MKTRHSKPGLPRDWSGLPGCDRLILQEDIRIFPRQKLAMKLLVFRTRRDMRKFWSRTGGCVGTGCPAAVQELGYTVLNFRGGRERRHREIDPRYWAVMGITLQGLRSAFEIITHEAVHAALAYQRRTKRRSVFWNAMENQEEGLCYPSGRIAAEVNRALHRNGVYERIYR